MADTTIGGIGLAASIVNDADLVEIEQAGVSKKATASLVRAGAGGGGLTIWDSGTTYHANDLVLDRGGTWKATGTNTNSQPVSGNSDWTLTGGTPYVDVLLDPVALTTAPFYDPGYSGPGLSTGLGAPGANLMIVPRIVDAFPTPGDPWGDTAKARFLYTSVLLGWPESTVYTTTDASLTDTNGSVPDFFNPNRSDMLAINAQLIANDPRIVVNAPLVMFTDHDVTFGGQFGTRSVRYRIYYDIVSVVASDKIFFHITGIVQGTKTITVNGDASALSGSINVVGSTGNNGTYTVVTAIFTTDHTAIVVAESLPDATADGWVKK